MKTKVVIENGETTIVLTPENVFETDLLDKIHRNKSAYNEHTSVEAEYSYGGYQKHRIEISIKEVRSN